MSFGGWTLSLAVCVLGKGGNGHMLINKFMFAEVYWAYQLQELLVQASSWP